MIRGTLMCETRCAVLALALMVAAASGEEAGAEPDDESDSAPFTVAVEHGAGSDWRCSAALLSLRTALTSARCARGPATPAADVWAHATQPGVVPAATRVLRIALDAAAAAGEGGAGWGAAETAHDVALLELSEALGGARPILLAAGRADCVPPRQCYAVRALSASRLRIVELELRAPAACWPAAAAHPADERAMCLAGPALCRSERGAGVVCGGKLCGVLSASLEGAADAPAGCGAPHAAGSAPRWRRFLHCAHTRGACGRDGECARLCSERWLEDEPRAEAPLPPQFAAPDEEPEHAPAEAPSPTEMHTDPRPSTPAPPTRTQQAAASPRPAALATPSAPASAATPPPPSAGTLASAGRHAMEFDPNRQDFTMRSSSVPTRVVLKAGEYGGAADYMGAAEEAPAATPATATATATAAANDTTPAPTASAPATPLAREQLAASLEAQISSNMKKKGKKNAASSLFTLSDFSIPLSALTFFIL